jgi:hypothetical protein
MADSKKNDPYYQDDSDSVIDFTVPITTEADMFNSLGGGGKLQPRIRKAPHVLGSTPSPPPSSPQKNGSKKNKKKKKKTAPLVNSARTNQSSSNNNNNNKNKTKKRIRNKSSSSSAKSSTTPIDLAPTLVPPSLTLKGNHLFVVCVLMLHVSRIPIIFFMIFHSFYSHFNTILSFF